MDSSSGHCQAYLKALSEETRWQMVQVLIASPVAMTLGDLAERIGISNYNASRHASSEITALRGCGFEGFDPKRKVKDRCFEFGVLFLRISRSNRADELAILLGSTRWGISGIVREIPSPTIL